MQVQRCLCAKRRRAGGVGVVLDQVGVVCIDARRIEQAHAVVVDLMRLARFVRRADGTNTIGDRVFARTGIRARAVLTVTVGTDRPPALLKIDGDPSYGNLPWRIAVRSRLVHRDATGAEVGNVTTFGKAL